MKNNIKEPLVSVIIPVYNVEKYLARCIDSILVQDNYKNIEIILVNDGSTDNSGEIADKYVTNNKNVKVIHKENAGPNYARRDGFLASSGDYIMFVDSDDVITKDYVVDMIGIILKNKADIVLGGFGSFENELEIKNRDGDWGLQKKNESKKTIVVSDQKEIYRYYMECHNSPTKDVDRFATVSLCGKIFRRTVLQQVDWDLANWTFSEDRYIIRQAYVLSKKIIFLYKTYYFYSQEPRPIKLSYGHKVLDNNGNDLVNKYGFMVHLYKDESKYISKKGWSDLKDSILLYVCYAMQWHILKDISVDALDNEAIEIIDNFLKPDLLKYIINSEYIKNNLSDSGEFFRFYQTVQEIGLRGAIRYYQSQNVIFAQSQTINNLSAQINYLTSVKGSLLNFLGKIKKRVIPRLIKMPIYILRKLKGVIQKLKYKDAWVIMDRYEDASDNGRYFYKWLHKNHPEIKAYFIINKNSSSVEGLKKEGFNLVYTETSDYYNLTKYARVAVLAYFTFKDFNPSSRQLLVYLGHGIDLPDVSGFYKNFPECIILNALEPEYNYYKNSPKFPFVDEIHRIALTGKPRFDILLQKYEKAKKTSNYKKDKIVIAPTWRKHYKALFNSGKINESIVNFKKSDFYKQWVDGILHSDSVKKLAIEYEIYYVVHPEMQPFVKFMEIPDYIKLTSYKELGEYAQDLMIHTKLLITDYSSVQIDFAFVGAVVTCMQFDRDHFYSANGSSLYEGWFVSRKNGFGPVFDDKADLLKYLDSRDFENIKKNKIYQKRIEKLLASMPRNAGENIYKLIEDNINEK